MPERVPKTVRELINRYLEERAPNVATIGSMRSHTKELVELWGDMTLDEICERGKLRDLCHEFHASKRSLADSTVRKKLTLLQSALRWAWKQQWISGLPVMWIPEGAEPVQRELTPSDRATLLAAADAYPTELHLRTFVYLAIFTQQPRGRILDLTWDQVSFEKNQILFPGRDSKKKTCPIPPVLREVLLHAREAKKSNYVIEWRGKKVASVYHGFRQLVKRAGLDIDTIDLRLGGSAEEPMQFDANSAYLFISYCAEDGKLQANALVAELERRGQRCFIAPRDMKVGTFAGQLTRAIQGADKFVILMTPEANDSAHVLQEVTKAFNSNKHIVPIIVDNTRYGEDLEHYLQGNQELQWSGAAKVAQELLGRLQKIAA